VTRNEILDHCVSELRLLGEGDMALAIEALKERTSVADSRVDERTDSPLPVTTAVENEATPATVSPEAEQRADDAFRELVTFTPEPDEPTDVDVMPRLRYRRHE
jgi:hypothetical protein